MATLFEKITPRKWGYRDRIFQVVTIDITEHNLVRYNWLGRVLYHNNYDVMGFMEGIVNNGYTPRV